MWVLPPSCHGRRSLATLPCPLPPEELQTQALGPGLPCPPSAAAPPGPCLSSWDDPRILPAPLLGRAPQPPRVDSGSCLMPLSNCHFVMGCVSLLN